MKPTAAAFRLVLLFAARLAVAAPEQLTFTGGGSPTVSPDGQSIGYADNGGIMKIPTAGGTPVGLTANGYDPDWSPTGDLIAFTVDDDLDVVDAGTGTPTLVFDSQPLNGPAWSPDGDAIACTGDDFLMFVAYPGGTYTVPPCIGECAGEGPDWSPDGTRLCYEDGLLIMTLPREGGSAETLVDCGDDVSGPAWSADGRFVAFSRQSADDSHIWVVDVATLDLYQVTTGSCSDDRPAWDPEGNWIYFESDRSGNREIWRTPFSVETAAEPMSWGEVKAMFGE